MRQTVGKERRRAAVRTTADALLGDAQPVPIADVEREARRAHGRLSAALLNYRLGAVNRDGLSRVLAADGWDPRWPGWMDARQALEKLARAGHLSADLLRPIRELFLFVQAGEYARALVSGYRAQRAAARNALARGDRSRALRLAGILTPDARGHGARYRLEHLAAYLELRHRGCSPQDAAKEVCARHRLSRAGFAEWLRGQRGALDAELRGLENAGADLPLEERLTTRLRTMKAWKVRDLRGCRALLTPLPKPGRRERSEKTELRVAVLSPRAGIITDGRVPTSYRNGNKLSRRARRATQTR